MGRSGSGSCCAVAVCSNSARKALKQGRQLSFFRFPRDLKTRFEWIYRCRRGDRWNPSTSYICSDHFTPSDIQRNLQAELLGTPSKRMLEPHAIPTLNLPGNLDIVEADGLVGRRKRVLMKEDQQYDLVKPEMIMLPPVKQDSFLPDDMEIKSGIHGMMQPVKEESSTNMVKDEELVFHEVDLPVKEELNADITRLYLQQTDQEAMEKYPGYQQVSFYKQYVDFTQKLRCLEMHNVCAVKHCPVSYKENSRERSLFRFPKELERCRQWAEACGQMIYFNRRISCGLTLYSSYYRVCSLHFEDWMYAGPSKKRLRSDAVPTLFLHNPA